MSASTMPTALRGKFPPAAYPVELYKVKYPSVIDLVGIAPERPTNNSQPSLHAHLLACAALGEGRTRLAG